MAAERRGDPWIAKEERSPLLRTLLWCTDALRGPIAAFGIDHATFRELLRVRVVLGLRPMSASTSAWGVAGVALVILMTWFAGLATGIVALLAEDPAVWVVASLSVLMFVLALVLFQVLAGILVDPTDIGVVAAHPVRDRTVFAVRLAEVSVYVLVIVVSFAAGSVLLAVLRQPPVAVLLVYPCLALLAGATALGLVALLFALCLRIVGPTHFQRVTLWAQIVGGGVIFAAAQVPRLVHTEQWGLWRDELEGLRFLWPPFQYAEAFALATGESAEPLAIVAALALPIALLAATFALASRYFVAGVQGTLSAPRPRVAWPAGLVTAIGRRVAPGLERCGFDFTAALSRREPSFLRGVLPQLVMFQVMSLGMGFGLRRDLSFFIPISAAFLFLVLPNVLTQSQGTPTPEARGLFESAPIADESELLRGGVKALLAQWFALPALGLACVQLFVAGLAALPRIVLAFALTGVAVLALTRRYRLTLPFTRPIRFGETGVANLGLVLLSGFVMMLLVGAHAALALHPLGLAAGLALAAWLLYVQWRALGRMRPVRERRAGDP